MKIDKLLNPLPGNSVKGSANSPSAASEKNAIAKSPAAPQDSVRISTPSSISDSGGAPIDNARVEAIKQAISEGRFKINYDAIADGLIATAKDLVMERRA